MFAKGKPNRLELKNKYQLTSNYKYTVFDEN